MSTKQLKYIGGELELFSSATNWKSYIAAAIRPYLGTRILEVGAGIGSTTQSLCAGLPTIERWVALEPDPCLAAQIRARIHSCQLPEACEVREGTIADLAPGDEFDSVLYIDVLEHIERDAEEVAMAASRLAAGGRLIVLAPAHQRLFTPFDEAIGHYRRYDRASLSALTPADVRCIKASYLDAVGLLASTCNKFFLKSARPTYSQILLWDRVMVRMSRVVDRIFGGALGKSILVVWEKSPAMSIRSAG
jgi:SAM-dependent methyltransferase